jgi:hypothetical protein
MPATKLEVDAAMVKRNQQAACRPDCGVDGRLGTGHIAHAPQLKGFEIAVDVEVDETVPTGRSGARS